MNARIVKCLSNSTNTNRHAANDHCLLQRSNGRKRKVVRERERKREPTRLQGQAARKYAVEKEEKRRIEKKRKRKKKETPFKMQRV
ncbi:hypothetical protein ASPZODRAFT_522929 [Penicilliopsis zonata CBS 506.65]|uniref:Uncharacterized protein n=1 Tax=Penicilliopsis zonata CBS 506.65 TaxID=1073090 RepID=A0A1L9SF40_9EURO|nr:hypothetical protein ASPZODRAFT_522929 [Penicilliopsis zonata CBS 506.65]OJJ45758.1 hypothetical protein ASPZODRAFT_522929 [Penicilliopsis zonata CBS 506.65]